MTKNPVYNKRNQSAFMNKLLLDAKTRSLLKRLLNSQRECLPVKSRTQKKLVKSAKKTTKK